MSKSPKEIYDFQNIKVEPSTLQQFQTSNAYSFIIELLIHEIKEEGFEKNEAQYQFGCGILKMVGPKMQDFWPRIDMLKGNCSKTILR